MRLLLIALVCALTGCSLDTVDDRPILFRCHHDCFGVDAGAVEPDAGIAGQPNVAGAAGAQAGSVALGGASGAAGQPQGGAPSAGTDGASAGSAGLAPTAGDSGAAGSAGLAGSAGDPSGGAPGGQGGTAGTSTDYHLGCSPGSNGGEPAPKAPLWCDANGAGCDPSWPEYIANIPVGGQVMAACGDFSPRGEKNPSPFNRCIFTCKDTTLCKANAPGQAYSTGWDWAVCDCSVVSQFDAGYCQKG